MIDLEKGVSSSYSQEDAYLLRLTEHCDVLLSPQVLINCNTAPKLS